ncbi:phage/plasmid replication protein, II/X family [Paraburkholderia heleia]|uniref:phage/plasmid replication protein, II/X family n=1 Tax=Paraburkholderia heleia TaxID=634127 RepID=UPI002AB693A9|nr:phage/plasmid replication protein, II/X family [Paraburkholderia heleia]
MSAYATSNQQPGVFIDRIKIKAPCTHRPTGKVLTYFDEDLGVEITVGATAVKRALQDGYDAMQVRSKEFSKDGSLAYFIEIDCCPPKVLQRHNMFGHAVLQDYVYEILDRVTSRFGIEVSDDDREEWLRGGVGITEIHLTANFTCPREHVVKIIDAIDQNNLQGKQRKHRTCITLGFTGKRRSKYHVLTVYDKYVELLEKFKNPGPYQTKVLAEAAQGIRAELKLFSMELAQLKLQYVMRWADVDVAALFFEFFVKYKVAHAIQAFPAHEPLKRLTTKERNVYQLWLAGVDVKEQFASRTTVLKYVEAIQQKVGVNVGVARRPEGKAVIDLKQVFSAANVRPVPGWAFGTPYFSPPSNLEDSSGAA